MPMDGLTAGFAARELNQTLRGGRIDKITQPERDTVVMVSDGVDSSLAEELIRDFSGEDMKTLTRALIDGAAGEMEDDVTAAAVRLTELRGR